MDTDSVQNLHTSKFKTIPHVNIIDLMPLEDIIIVKSHKSRNTKRRKKTVDEVYPSDDGSYQDVTILDGVLNEKFPQNSIIPENFRQKFEKLMSYMDEINTKAVNIELENSKTDGSESENYGIEKINRLRVSASLNRILQRNLRTPTINEFINVATNMNIKEMEDSNDLNADDLSSDIKWSEVNLFNFFNQRVNLDSYRLVSGSLKFSFKSHYANRSLVSGPKCDLTPLSFHKRATERFFRNNTETNPLIVDDNEVIVTVIFYHNVRGHKYREFDILSSQTLADLTDSFKCSSEITSDDFDLEIKGSCYMLRGILYPDLRNNACDYSEQLREFYRSYKPNFLKSDTPVRQDKAIINNIELKLYDSGYFLHYGNCEHRVTITNVRIIDKSRDCPYVKCYPLCTFIPNQNKMDCQVCNSNEVSKVVFNSILLPENPSYLCNDCDEKFKMVKLGSDVYFDNGLEPPITINYNED